MDSWAGVCIISRNVLLRDLCAIYNSTALSSLKPRLITLLSFPVLHGSKWGEGEIQYKQDTPLAFIKTIKTMLKAQ